MSLLNSVRAGLFLAISSILAGAIVRATGSGDGCGSTWPTCKGRVIPELSDIPELIEFSHRAVSGILLVVTLIIFLKTRDLEKNNLKKVISNYLTFFVVLEAVIGAVIVLFEWVGLNSSLPRIVAVPIHLVNTFGLLACFIALYKVVKDDQQSIKGIVDNQFLVVLCLFLLSGATGSITALADVLFPSESFIQGFVEDFDETSELLTRLRILHPIVASLLSITLFFESNRLKKTYKLNTKSLKLMVLVAVTLGVVNVLSNIWLPLSVFHLAIADFLWITYIYVSIEKTRNNLSINSL
jgi:heme A synthase